MPFNATTGRWEPGGLLTGEQAVSGGLTQAAGLMSAYTPAPYPAFVPSQTRAPTQQNYMNYTPNQPMAQIQTPNYKGLMGGDYDALQQALTTPGQIAAQNAYNTANRDLTNTMGGRGLYGSSIMANQANEGLNREYMNAMAINAANAAAQRYGLQSTNLQNENAYGLNATQLGMTQNQNTYQAGLTDAARQQEYNLGALTYGNQGTEMQRQWENQQALEQMQYALASGQYTNEQQTAMINQYLALAGRGQVTAGQNATTAAQQEAADAAQQQALYGGLAGLGTTGLLAYLYGKG